MKNPKVLIVDDEKNIRDLLEAGLKFAGFSVYSVGTGTEAVAVAEKSKTRHHGSRCHAA
jgi:two-component system OmpR family response regulator